MAYLVKPLILLTVTQEPIKRVVVVVKDSTSPSILENQPALGLVFFDAPSMGAYLRVQVTMRADHSEQSEAQLRKGDRA